MKNYTRRLLFSMITMIVCMAMLVGSTFAWFTDVAKSTNNVINPGRLELEVEYTLDGETWENLDGAENIFGDGLFEPGYTRVVAFKVKNSGSLAFKYSMSLDVISETKGINVAGEEFSLADYLQVSTSAAQEWSNGENAIARIYLGLAFDRTDSGSIGWTTTTLKDFTFGTRDVVLSQGQDVIYMLRIQMPTNVGNDANARDDASLPSLNLGVTVVATQATVESDSYDNKYDANATYPDVVFIDNDTVEDELVADKKVINVALSENVTIDVKPYDLKPLGGASTEAIIIDGQGKKITFNQTNSDWNNITWGDAKLIIKNAVIDNSGYNADGGPWNAHNITFKGNVELKDVTFTNAVALNGKATLTNVKISDKSATADTYMLWIVAGSDVTLDNCTIDGTSSSGKANRAVAIKDQYVTDPGMTTLRVKGGKISSDKYAAVLVTSAGGADITFAGSVNISETQDATNAVWFDGSDANITVTGCTKKAR